MGSLPREEDRDLAGLLRAIIGNAACIILDVSFTKNHCGARPDLACSELKFDFVASFFEFRIH